MAPGTLSSRHKELGGSVTSSKIRKPTAATALTTKNAERAYLITVAFNDKGYSVGRSKGSTEPFPDFGDSTGVAGSLGEAHCTCMLHCQHRVCKRIRDKSQGDLVPSCPHPRTCRELLRSRHGLRPLHLVRAPSQSLPPWLRYAGRGPRRAPTPTPAVAFRDISRGYDIICELQSSTWSPSSRAVIVMIYMPQHEVAKIIL
ncbi:hypothetical protein P171DRAFT_447821 [Karstenula rhodostoma CBS 690.94]|uniref:Uncharacterized protein n=1 Tax=Karstenula rhodostoma CBS 690.94 TaxID=1392251 RepID=A0A9P4U7H5_9PLEO|nr:hypothetical protein P171DRAFT_447821 [Karstenula rhodostoma CBS 690.94]